MDYSLHNCGGHIEVTDGYGRFLFSADTVAEANRELREMEQVEKRE